MREREKDARGKRKGRRGGKRAESEASTTPPAESTAVCNHGRLTPTSGGLGVFFLLVNGQKVFVFLNWVNLVFF